MAVGPCSVHRVSEVHFPSKRWWERVKTFILHATLQSRILGQLQKGAFGHHHQNTRLPRLWNAGFIRQAGKSRVGLPHKCGVPVAGSQVTPLHNPRHPPVKPPQGVFSGAYPWFNSFNGHCLWGTEFENSVESLRVTKGQGCGAGRAAIGPACGGTRGGHFPGRRGEPGYKVRRVFDLISGASGGGPSQGEGILSG